MHPDAFLVLGWGMHHIFNFPESASCLLTGIQGHWQRNWPAHDDLAWTGALRHRQDKQTRLLTSHMLNTWAHKYHVVLVIHTELCHHPPSGNSTGVMGHDRISSASVCQKGTAGPLRQSDLCNKHNHKDCIQWMYSEIQQTWIMCCNAKFEVNHS